MRHCGKKILIKNLELNGKAIQQDLNLVSIIQTNAELLIKILTINKI